MALSKYKLGELIELIDVRNSDMRYGFEDVRGVNNLKQLMPTRADLSTRDLSKFQIVEPHCFVFNHRTSRNGEKFSIAYNDTDKPVICTEDYVVFRIKADCETIILAYFLYIYFNRSEFDRYVITNSWGSSTEFYNWEDICDIDLDLPPLAVQQKYVNIYKSMLENQRCYETALDDLKLVCDAYIEDLRRKIKCEKIAPYIRECDEKNLDGNITLAQGVTVDMVFADPKRIADDTESTRIVRTGQFAYNKVMKSNGTKLPIALREGEDCIVSGSYQVFEVCRTDKLMPEYLMMCLSRSETQRHAGFDSWGSTRDIFSFDLMCDVQIPIPEIKIQRSIADIYKVYVERKRINEQLKEQIKDICPVLIRGAVMEGKKA